MAQRYHCRPSDIARGAWWSYQFDQAVMMVAMDEDARREGRPRLLADPPPPVRPPFTTTAAPAFAPLADVAQRFGGITKMQIPDDGIW